MLQKNLLVAFLLSLFWMVGLVGCTQAQAEVADATVVPTAELTDTHQYTRAYGHSHANPDTYVNCYRNGQTEDGQSTDLTVACYCQQ